MTAFNDDLVEARRPTPAEGERLLGLVDTHARMTGSGVAHDVLGDWDDQHFWRIAPKADAAGIEGGHEGSAA